MTTRLRPVLAIAAIVVLTGLTVLTVLTLINSINGLSTSRAAPAAVGAPADAQHGGSGHGGGGALELWAVQTEALGVVVTDGGGRLLYRRDGDTATSTTCVDACTESWAPVLSTGDGPELLGVDPSVVGTLARPDGAVQVTLGGLPLYTRVGEAAGLTDTGSNGTDGVWFAVRPDGTKAA
jgi:predicted lipoprotein with Yx(FWY)xxD motif